MSYHGFGESQTRVQCSGPWVVDFFLARLVEMLACSASLLEAQSVADACAQNEHAHLLLSYFWSVF
jgi:hypothetical protein